MFSVQRSMFNVQGSGIRYQLFVIGGQGSAFNVQRSGIAAVALRASSPGQTQSIFLQRSDGVFLLETE
jgi:hypothetical protein